MKSVVLLLAVIAAGCASTCTAPISTSSAPPDRLLLIDSSTMPLTLGSATLIIGNLQHSNGVYTGSYHIKVFPYFLKNDNGRLAIFVSDESLAGVDQGKVTKVTGTATSTKRSVPTLHIDAVATPTSGNDGKLKIQFQVGGRKMVFEPAYHFIGKEPAMVPAQTTTKL